MIKTPRFIVSLDSFFTLSLCPLWSTFNVQIMPVCFIRFVPVKVEATYTHMDLLVSLRLSHVFEKRGLKEEHMHIHLITDTLAVAKRVKKMLSQTRHLFGTFK